MPQKSLSGLFWRCEQSPQIAYSCGLRGLSVKTVCSLSGEKTAHSKKLRAKFAAGRTGWRRGRDSNPCGIAPKRFSRPPRYDHFDTSPNTHIFYHNSGVLSRAFAKKSTFSEKRLPKIRQPISLSVHVKRRKLRINGGFSKFLLNPQQTVVLLNTLRA